MDAQTRIGTNLLFVCFDRPNAFTPSPLQTDFVLHNPAIERPATILDTAFRSVRSMEVKSNMRHAVGISAFHRARREPPVKDVEVWTKCSTSLSHISQSRLLIVSDQCGRGWNATNDLLDHVRFVCANLYRDACLRMWLFCCFYAKAVYDLSATYAGIYVLMHRASACSHTRAFT